MTENKAAADKQIPQFHVMVKPFGSTCNLDCSYCYYLSKEHFIYDKPGKISDVVLEQFIKQYIEGHGVGNVIFSWQGGEPTLLGIDFFKKVLIYQEKWSNPNIKCDNDLQTNGTLLNDDWCKFLKENNFLVGLSIDGPEHLHDYYRCYSNDEGSFDKVMNAANLLNKYGVEFNTLTTVNRENAKHPLAVYRFLRDEVKSKRMQFIPVANPNEFTEKAAQYINKELPLMGSKQAKPGYDNSIATDWSVDPDEFGNFLCRIFDEWYKYDIGKTWIYTFESAVYTAIGMESPVCVFKPDCPFCLVMEHDGSIFSCDHYVYPEYKLGNIMDNHLTRYVYSLPQLNFSSKKRNSLTNYCKQCPVLEYCNGECPKNRFISSPEGEPGHNYLCSGYRKFFEYVKPRIQLLAEDVKKNLKL